jgi:hypothetical protein
MVSNYPRKAGVEVPRDGVKVWGWEGVCGVEISAGLENARNRPDNERQK